MSKYTRKTKTIDAIQWDGTLDGMWMIEKELGVHSYNLSTKPEETFWRIITKNGTRNVLPGHYVIKNEAGSFWTLDQHGLDDYEKVECLDQVFDDSYDGRAKLYESISDKICSLHRQKTLVFNEMQALEHAEDIDKD